MNPKELRQKRAALAEQAAAIARKYKDGDRWSQQDQAEFDSLHAQCEVMLADIEHGERMERQEELDAEMRASQGTRAGQQDRSPWSDGPGSVGYQGDRFGGQPSDDLRTWHTPNGETRALLHNESVAAYCATRGDTPDELSGMRPGQMLRMLAVGPRDERERRAMAFGLDTAGGFTVGGQLANRIIDLMRAQSVVSRAGAVTIPLGGGQTAIAKLASDPVLLWHAENQPVAESDPTFTAVVMNFRVLAVIVKASYELFQDSANVEAALTNAFVQSMALAWDKAVMIGAGEPLEPLGITNTVGVQEEAHNAALQNYDAFLKARTRLLTVNSAEPTAVLLHAREEGALSLLKDGEGLPYPVPPRLQNVPFLVSNQLPVDGGDGSNEGTAIVADFSRCLIGIRSELRIEVSRTRFMEDMQVAFLAWLRMDSALEHSAAFVKVTGITPSE